MSTSLPTTSRLLYYTRAFAQPLATVGSYPLVKLALVALWILVLWRGENSNFSSLVSSCHWDKWENWPADALPHRLVLLADPQLIDPHTYPGRPWPLDRLTILHTDQFLRRGYAQIQKVLDPDSIFFLGDLFDGGREWSTSVAYNPDKQWRKWGEDFWLQEYDRWGRIFLRDNGETARTGDHPRGDRKFVASLPGNHDLGISNGVRLDVRNRYEMFFGPGNRIDVVGNHSIVSVDTVSLTAKALQSSQERSDSKEVWGPPSAFLDDVKVGKAQALERYLNAKSGKPEHPRMDHSVHDVTDAKVKETIKISGDGLESDVPTILLTHVPLFRAKGTPCGPLREKYPPSVKGTGNPDEPISDERNALSLHGGYQYQNVLDPEISKELIEKVGNVAHVFSGDDHDYCEVVHRGYTSAGGGVREITVKSMSWAMGVRKPGFQLVSLWNPIDEHGKPLAGQSAAQGPTIQTKLCILPDALGTFIGYGEMFALTLVVLFTIAFIGSGKPRGTQYEAILPMNEIGADRLHVNGRYPDASSCSASSNSSDASNGLAARSTGPRSRGSEGGWAMPASNDDYSPKSRGIPSPRKETRLRRTLGELHASLMQVGLAGFLFYAWLAVNV